MKNVAGWMILGVLLNGCGQVQSIGSAGGSVQSDAQAQRIQAGDITAPVVVDEESAEQQTSQLRPECRVIAALDAHPLVLDVRDQIAFQQQFGSTAATSTRPLTADFNGDGAVNTLDLVVFIGLWGECFGNAYTQEADL